MRNPVETTALTKRYDAITAVDELNLTVRTGEVYGFLGPNGAGKTTTLRMLLGLVKPTSAACACSARHRARVDAVLATVELTHRSADRYRTYSLGMKQRLGLAAAMLKEPELLILDEPTNGLDPAGMADMRPTIRKLAADGCTVLLSSHLLAEVEQICDRVGVISDGRLVAEAAVTELRSGGMLRVVADPIDTARAHLSALLGEGRVHADSDALDLEVVPGQAAEINAELVGSGVSVRELRWREPDLEQTFLELTGSGPHAG